MTTYDEAKECPKCGKQGEVTQIHQADRMRFPRGTEVHIITCRNSLCIWYNEVSRIIQVNPDGSIPEPSRTRQGEKLFPALPEDFRQRVADSLARQVEAETSKEGGEINR